MNESTHIVTHNLFSYTFDHVVNVNGNTLIFFLKYFFSLLMVTFLIIIGRVPALCVSGYFFSLKENSDSHEITFLIELAHGASKTRTSTED